MMWSVTLEPLFHLCRTQQFPIQRRSNPNHFSFTPFSSLTTSSSFSTNNTAIFHQPHRSHRPLSPPLPAASATDTPTLHSSHCSDSFFTKTFPINRTQLVEGKIFVRLDHGKDLKKWDLTVGCNLPGKWILHWGVSHVDDVGREWDQPPRDMIPHGSVPIKDYAIETPLKKSSVSAEGDTFHEVRIGLKPNNKISAINFVLKDEETGAWYQHKGRDFKVPLVKYLKAPKRGFSLWPGNLGKISNMLLKSKTAVHNGQDNSSESRNPKEENSQLEGFYVEMPITKEISINNSVSVSIKKCYESERFNNLLYFETDIPGDIVLHWGVCRDDSRRWEVPPDPHPPDTVAFKDKALRTKLQPGDSTKGSSVLITFGEEFSGFLFVLKQNENTWFKCNGNDFYIPILSSNSFRREDQSNGFPKGATKEASQELSFFSFKNGIINEIKNLVTDSSSDKSRKTKSEEAKDSIFQEIERLAAEAYNIFRSSIPTFSEATIVEPEAAVVEPETDVVEPEAAVVEPEAAVESKDSSSDKSRKTKSEEAKDSIFQEIERLAAEAYNIFRSSIPTFSEATIVEPEAAVVEPETDVVEPEAAVVEPEAAVESERPRLSPDLKICSGTGSGYEILCQGFNWESHKSGRWYMELKDKASELASIGFTVIWLPPPTESVSPEGYMPKDLYNLNSRYGNINELKDLVKIFHEVGIRALGDAVLNHRCAHYQNQNGIWNIFGGHLDWDDRAVVADDPHFQGRGNKSSGDNFHAAPNIDHSQEFVRKDIKEWLCWLRKEIGYDGWRLDFVRGFWGGYVKDYLDASEPYFAVGEYWDSLSYTYDEMDHNQDAHRQRIVDWINATNGTAGAFDVTTKGILHSALERCEYWRLSDQKGKPPGVVGWWPSRAVTFIENHDTGSTQGHWRFPSGKEMQGYAYILTHPGTPSVFFDHIFSYYKAEIATLISIRKRNQIHCRSAVQIIKAERDVYAAIIDEKVVMKIGPGHFEPPSSRGSKKWSLAIEGREYKIWEAS